MLAGWHGWGSFPGVFDERRSRTRSEHAAREQISRAEQRWPGYLDTARRTTLNAHYTDPALIAPVWQLLRRLGYGDDHVAFEPGAGSGLWLRDPQATIVHGVELDPVSAWIADALAPAPSRVEHANLVDTGLPASGPGSDGYDLVVGNVPFASVAPHAPDNPERLSLHNYTIVKAATMTRPGGHLAVLTSRHTLDAVTPTARNQLAALTSLVAAIRLPSGTHAERAGTEVVTDLLILQRSDDPATLCGWPTPTAIDVDGATINVSDYFVEHPDHIIGRFTLGGMRHRDDLRVAHDGIAAGDHLDAYRRLLDDVAERAEHARPHGRAPSAARPTRPVAELPPGSILIIGHRRFARVTAHGTESLKVPGTQAAELTALCRLRDAVRAVLAADAAGDPDPEPRATLNALYHGYVARYGPLNRYHTRPVQPGRRQLDEPDDAEPADEPDTKRIYPRMGGFRSDPGWWPVAALEVFDDETQTARPAPLLQRPVLRTASYPDHVDDPATAVRVLLARDGELTVDAVAELAGIATDDVIDWLGDRAYLDPDSRQLVDADRYLTGLVRPKLERAQAAADDDPAFARNVAALTAALPTPLTNHEITPRIGAPWIPVDDLRQFLADELHLDHAKVVHVAATATWTISAGGYSAENFYTYAVAGKRTAVELIEDIANQRATRITRQEGDRRVLDVEQTAAATNVRGQLEDLFATWIWTDPARTDRLTATYNERFNSFVEPRWDGTQLQLDGLAAGFTPRPHQLDAVARILGDRDRGTLLAHAVGAGKTAVMVIAAMELRRLGIAGGPVGIVVPNSMLQQFARECQQLYPQAAILAAEPHNFARDQRREFVARAASGAYDIVLFTHTSFTAIPASPATILAAHRAELDGYRAAHTTLSTTDSDEATARSVKQIETAIARAEERLKRLEDRSHHDDGSVSFEQLGLGHLMIDEAHLAKNLSFPTRIDNVQVRESARARDLLTKADWLRDQRNPGSLTFATATPVTNQISEMWVFQRFLDPAGLAASGCDQFDAWAANFAQTITAVEIAPSGSGFRTTTRFARFTNVPEIGRAFRAFADVRTTNQLNLPRPAIRSGEPTTIVVDADNDLSAFMADLVQRSNRIRNTRRPDPGEDNFLAIGNDGRVGALDMRLASRTLGYGPTHGPSSKIARAADEIAARYHANAATEYRNASDQPAAVTGAAQIVFCDHGVPDGGARRDIYADLTAALVEHGVPRRRIAAVQDARTHDDRARLFADVRDGRIAVLIGSTHSMGVGVNVQTRLIASHILTPPWRPDEVEQAEGRILRQGNQNPEVELLRYVTAGSYDAYTWQTIERKARFIAQIMTAPERRARDLTDEDAVADEYAVLKAIATGDPRLLEVAKLESRITSLDRARRVHDQGQARMRAHLDRARNAAAHATRTLDALRPHLEGHDRHAGIVLHHPDGHHDHIPTGTVGATERLGQHVIEHIRSRAAATDHDGAPIATIENIPVTVEISGQRARAIPTGCDHDTVRREWNTTEIRFRNPNPLGIGQATVNLVRGLPERHEQLHATATIEQQRADELASRSGGEFAHRGELDALRSQLVALQAELMPDLEHEPDRPAPEPAAPTAARRRGERDRGIDL